MGPNPGLSPPERTAPLPAKRAIYAWRRALAIDRAGAGEPRGRAAESPSVASYLVSARCLARQVVSADGVRSPLPRHRQRRGPTTQAGLASGPAGCFNGDDSGRPQLPGLFMSPDCDHNPEWVRYERHRVATPADWDAGIPLRRSAEPRGRAQYNPYRFGSDEAVREMELRCFRTGKPLPGKRARYLQTEEVVGVGSGFVTSLVYAECTSGFVHGRPSSPQVLRERWGIEA